VLSAWLQEVFHLLMSFGDHHHNHLNPCEHGYDHINPRGDICGDVHDGTVAGFV
jgi:hypothetical protein